MGLEVTLVQVPAQFFIKKILKNARTHYRSSYEVFLEKIKTWIFQYLETEVKLKMSF